MWRGEWIPCSSWKLHPAVASTRPNPFKHAWDKNRAYFLKIGCFFVFGILGASVWHGEWIPCSSWKLHPAVASTSPNPFKHAWDKNRAYFLKIGCFLFLVFLGLLCMVFLSVWFGYCPHEKCQFSPVGQPRASGSKDCLFKSHCGSILLFLGLLCGVVSGSTPNSGLYKPQFLQACLGQKSGLFLKNRLFFGFWCFWGSVWRGEWSPCSSWKLHPTVGSTSPNSFKHAWDKNRAYFLKIGCFFVFGLLGASVWRGEWIPCSSWKLHPTVGSTSPNSFKHAWDKNRAYFLKIGCFLFLVFLGLLCGVVSGSPVAPGNYTQQWPLQAPIPSSMLETKIGPIS